MALILTVLMTAVLLATCYGLWIFVPDMAAGTVIGEFQVLVPAVVIAVFLSAVHRLLLVMKLER